MKILVTGASGFIGNYVVKELMKYNQHKIITTSISKDETRTCSWFNDVKFIECDLNEKRGNYFQLFEEPDLLIHLAWEGLPNYNELYHIEKNLISNYYFIKNMVENGLKKVSVIGTCLEYGLINGCINEEMPTKPTTPYGLAKDTLRRFISILQNKFQFNFKWIRLFYLYGEGQAKSSILSQLQTALDNNEESFNMSKGDQLRDYLPIEKIAEYIVKISIQNKEGVFNCCSGKPISIRTLVEQYLKKKGKAIKLNLGYYPYANYEPMAFWGDNTKLNDLLNDK